MNVTKETPIHTFFISSTSHAKITSWSVAPDDKVRRGVVLLSYTLNDGQSDCQQLKSSLLGVVRKTTYNVGDIVPPGYVITKCINYVSTDTSNKILDTFTPCGAGMWVGAPLICHA